MLNKLFKLPPLTMVEIADRSTLREAFIEPRKGLFECPYWFFQRVHADGRLVVASPGGGLENVDAIDVMNIIPTEPIRVMAMPSQIFIKRLGLSHQERYDTRGPECFRPAYVMAAQRDRFGGFDYNVWFEAHEFNVSSTYTAPLLDGERERLKPLTTRRNMPVRNLSTSANWSSDTKAQGIERTHAKKAKSFVAAAMQGKSRMVARHCGLDAATLN
jgi:hypothetical protein